MATVSLDDPKLGEQLKELLTAGVKEIVFLQGSTQVRTVVRDDPTVHPIEAPLATRPLGLWADTIGPVWMSDDFSDELPDSFWLGEDE